MPRRGPKDLQSIEAGAVGARLAIASGYGRRSVSQNRLRCDARSGQPLTVLDEEAGTVERVALELTLELSEGEASLERRGGSIGLCHAEVASWLAAVSRTEVGMRSGW